MGWLSLAFFLVGFALAYWLWLRPLLKSRPQFKDFYAATDSFWAALWGKFNTIKTKASAAFVMIASTLVGLHDFLLPIITGIDWTPVTANVPAWVWPIASFGIGALFLWLRHVTERTQDVQLTAVAAGATPEEAKVVAGIEPLTPLPPV
jgi:hypothetical protein